MELIPILATIILMATISTFFLAVGAYVLYKIREKRGFKAPKPVPQTIQAELVTPEMLQEQVAQAAEQQVRAPVRPFEKPNPVAYRPAAPDPIFMQKKSSQAQPVQQRIVASQPEPAPMRAEPPKAGPAPQQAAGPGEQKFVKITREGNVSVREDKNKGALKWR